MKVLDENCPGPIVRKDKADRISKLMDKIRPERETRKKPSLSFIQGNNFSLKFDSVINEIIFILSGKIKEAIRRFM